MASQAYSNGVEKLLDNAYDFTSTIKSMLIRQGYEADSGSQLPDQEFVDVAGTTTDLLGWECNATGYTGGFAGADRLTATIVTTEQTANNRVVVIATDQTWTAIGGAANNTLEGVAWIFEVTNDAASIPIVWLLFTSALTTNGSDILVDYDGTDGNLRFTV